MSMRHALTASLLVCTCATHGTADDAAPAPAPAPTPAPHHASFLECDLIYGGAASLNDVDGIDTTPSTKSYQIEIDALRRCSPASASDGQWLYGAGLFYEQQCAVLSGDSHPPKEYSRGIAIIGGRAIPFSDGAERFSYQTLVYTRMGYATGDNGFGHGVRGLNVEFGTRQGVEFNPFRNSAWKIGVLLDLQFSTIRPHGLHGDERAFDFSPEAAIGYVF